MKRTAIAGLGFGCLILAFVLCAVVLVLGFGLGMERVTSDSPLPPGKEYWWNMSQYFFFIALLLRGHWDSSLATCTALAGQVGFYALLLFAPAFLLCRRIARSQKP